MSTYTNTKLARLVVMVLLLELPCILCPLRAIVRLLVFGTATYLLANAGLDSDTWGLIAIVYIGGQSAVDTMKAWRHGR